MPPSNCKCSFSHLYLGVREGLKVYLPDTQICHLKLCCSKPLLRLAAAARGLGPGVRHHASTAAGRASGEGVGEQRKPKQTAGQPLTTASGQRAVVGRPGRPGTPYHEVTRGPQRHRAVWNQNIITTYERCPVWFCPEKPHTLFKPRLRSQSCSKKKKKASLLDPCCLCVTANPFYLFLSFFIPTSSAKPAQLQENEPNSILAHVSNSIVYPRQSQSLHCKQ